MEARGTIGKKRKVRGKSKEVGSRRKNEKKEKERKKWNSGKRK